MYIQRLRHKPHFLASKQSFNAVYFQSTSRGLIQENGRNLHLYDGKTLDEKYSSTARHDERKYCTK